MARQAFTREITLTVADGATASTSPDIQVGRGGTIYQVSVALHGASQGPALANVVYWAAGKRISPAPIVAGWVRAGSVITESGALFWDGFLPIKEDGEVQCTIRNDSGATITYRLTVVGID